MSFKLDARLEADTYWMGDLHLSRVLLMNDRRYPWIILVPMLEGLKELTDLSEEQSVTLLQESRAVSQWLIKQGGDKLNVGALGNVVSQLHLHHVMRKVDDPAWPGPVWGHSPAEPYAEDKVNALQQSLKATLKLDTSLD
jgi:diadenosine tetraphosphate (Ap4A) HIT family hydrolase